MTSDGRSLSAPRPHRWPWLRAAVLLLLGVHVVWGLARVPSRVVGRRLEHIERYRELGDAGYLFDTAHLGGAEALRWVREHTPQDSVVLWDGEPMGALEFAPGLLAPRLVVSVVQCPPGRAMHAGRVVARALRDGRHGAVVLVGERTGLRLELR